MIADAERSELRAGERVVQRSRTAEQAPVFEAALAAGAVARGTWTPSGRRCAGSGQINRSSSSRTRTGWWRQPRGRRSRTSRGPCVATSPAWLRTPRSTGWPVNDGRLASGPGWTRPMACGACTAGSTRTPGGGCTTASTPRSPRCSPRRRPTPARTIPARSRTTSEPWPWRRSSSGPCPAAPAGPRAMVVVDVTSPAGPEVDWGLPVELPWRVLEDLFGATDPSVVVVRNGVVLHAPGQLDLGRSTRLASKAQRRALRALYPTCAIPGCGVRFRYTQPHHITWWEHGGATDFANLLPLCDRHHHCVHDKDKGWRLRLGARPGAGGRPAGRSGHDDGPTEAPGGVRWGGAELAGRQWEAGPSVSGRGPRRGRRAPARRW